MNIPKFTAEASLYQTSNHYRFAAGGNSLNDGKTTVIPQGCNFIEAGVCGGAVVGVGALCLSACIAGPVPCAACWGGAMPLALYGFCWDCIPDWIRDLIREGGGGPPTTCRNPASCSFNYDCCPDHVCLDNQCVHCSKGTCWPFGRVPCCSGWRCIAGRCQPEGTHPL